MEVLISKTTPARSTRWASRGQGKGQDPVADALGCPAGVVRLPIRPEQVRALADDGNKPAARVFREPFSV